MFLTCPTGSSRSENLTTIPVWKLHCPLPWEDGTKSTGSWLWAPLNYTLHASGCQGGFVLLSAGTWEKREKNTEISIPSNWVSQGTEPQFINRGFAFFCLSYTGIIMEDLGHMEIIPSEGRKQTTKSHMVEVGCYILK